MNALTVFASVTTFTPINIVYHVCLAVVLHPMSADAVSLTTTKQDSLHGVTSLFERPVCKKIKGSRLPLKRINCHDDRTVLQKHVDATNLETQNLMIMKFWTVAVALSVAWIRYTR
jgi:hypothetical protein